MHLHHLFLVPLATSAKPPRLTVDSVLPDTIAFRKRRCRSYVRWDFSQLLGRSAVPRVHLVFSVHQGPFRQTIRAKYAPGVVTVQVATLFPVLAVRTTPSLVDLMRASVSTVHLAMTVNLEREHLTQLNYAQQEAIVPQAVQSLARAERTTAWRDSLWNRLVCVARLVFIVVSDNVNHNFVPRAITVLGVLLHLPLALLVHTEA
jgi:hypothetical protein